MAQFFRFLPFFIYGIALTWIVRYNPFFWDTVQLASKHAHFFYESGLNWAPLPPEIDSGHPPFTGYYLAAVWSVFGKSLPVAHWAMLPFLLGAIWMLCRLGLRLAGKKWGLWLLPLVLLDPVFAGQSVLIGPDLILVCWFLMALEGLLGKNRWLAALGVLGLCTVSMRGMMTAGALLAWRLLVHFYNRRTFRLLSGDRTRKAVFLHFGKETGVFLPGFVAALSFIRWHQIMAGWTGFHPGSPWAPAFERVDMAGLVKNILVLGWRWLDFGRLGNWLILGGLIWLQVRKKGPPFPKEILFLFACLLAFLSPSALIYQNLSAHRYFLPAFICLHMFVFQWLAQINRTPLFKTTVFSIWILVLASGNLWVYPRGVSMDWDSTLAHLPYYRLREDAVDFLERENIDFNTVGSAFPNLNTGENLMLNGDLRQFSPKEFERSAFIFASNIFNDFSEADYDLLRREWSLIYRKEQANVWIEIYRR